MLSSISLPTLAAEAKAAAAANTASEAKAAGEAKAGVRSPPTV